MGRVKSRPVGSLADEGIYVWKPFNVFLVFWVSIASLDYLAWRASIWLVFFFEFGQFWQNMGMFAAVSNDTQHALAMMLEDETFVDRYVQENNRLVSS